MRSYACVFRWRLSKIVPYFTCYTIYTITLHLFYRFIFSVLKMHFKIHLLTITNTLKFFFYST